MVNGPVLLANNSMGEIFHSIASLISDGAQDGYHRKRNSGKPQTNPESKFLDIGATIRRSDEDDMIQPFTVIPGGRTWILKGRVRGGEVRGRPFS